MRTPLFRPLAALPVMFAFALFHLSAAAQQTQPSNPDTSTPTPTTAPQASPANQDAAQQDASQNADKNDSAKKDTDKKDSETNGQSNSSSSGNQGKVAGTSNDRLFYALPNFLTLQGNDKLPPLTAKEKFKVVALGTFDPVQYPWWGLLSAISQADNSEPQFGQGWLAYAKRYGTTAGDSTTENFMVGAVFPSLLHQDPRFYQSGKGSIPRRTVYAATRILVTRGDSGKKEFNFSEIVGSALAAAVSDYTYHPRSAYISTPSNPHEFVSSDRTLSNTADVWRTQVALDTITFVIKEFWPDVHRKLSHKHQGDATQPAASNP